jgi:hypothetical protein
MDGAFYRDLREPFIGTDPSAVTLAATYKALVPVSNLPPLGTHYFGRIGKKVRIRLFGRMTTALTPGNMQIAIFYGTGADANGVNLQASAAVALSASQTNLSWEAEFTVHCRSLGSAGTLFADGKFLCNNALIASTLQPVMIPASAAAVSGACDLTSATLVLSPQMLRSGSTAESVTVHDLEFEALN